MKLLRWSYLTLALAQEWEAQNDVERGEIGIPAQVKYRAEPFSYEYSDFEESFAGLLGKRQTYVCTKSGYGKCVYYNYCCRLGVGNKCCGNNICCPSGYGCCDGKGCSPDGYQCCKGGTYCDPGWNCYTYASGTPGCCPSGYSPCSSLDGCCPTGSTCYVDTNGNKKCRTYGSVPTYSEETRTFSRTYETSVSRTAPVSSVSATAVPSSTGSIPTATPSPPSVPTSTLIWVSLNSNWGSGEGFSNGEGDWNEAASSCNASDISKWSQAETFAVVATFQFKISPGHGARISLRASTSTEIDISSTGVGRELTYERWRYVGKSSARTPGEDDVCEEGLTFENPSSADSSLTISIQFLGFVNESTLERRQSSADWLKVNGFWTYDLSASSTPTSIPSQPASGSSGSTVLTLAGNHWHLVVATVLCSTIFNLFT